MRRFASVDASNDPSARARTTQTRSKNKHEHNGYHRTLRIYFLYFWWARHLLQHHRPSTTQYAQVTLSFLQTHCATEVIFEPLPFQLELLLLCWRRRPGKGISSGVRCASSQRSIRIVASSTINKTATENLSMNWRVLEENIPLKKPLNEQISFNATRGGLIAEFAQVFNLALPLPLPISKL